MSVEHSLSGLAVFVGGAVVEGVAGWGSNLSFLTSEAGVKTTLFGTILEESLGGSSDARCWADELYCEAAQDVVRVVGCHSMSQGVTSLEALAQSGEWAKE